MPETTAKAAKRERDARAAATKKVQDAGRNASVALEEMATAKADAVTPFDDKPGTCPECGAEAKRLQAHRMATHGTGR